MYAYVDWYCLPSSIVKRHDDKLYDRLLSSSLLFNSTRASLDSVMLSREFMKEWNNPASCLATMRWPAIAEPSIPSIYASMPTRCLRGNYGHHTASAGNVTDPGLPTLSHQGKDFPCVLPFNRDCGHPKPARDGQAARLFWVVSGKGGTWLYERSVRYWSSIEFKHPFFITNIIHQVKSTHTTAPLRSIIGKSDKISLAHLPSRGGSPTLWCHNVPAPFFSGWIRCFARFCGVPSFNPKIVLSKSPLLDFRILQIHSLCHVALEEIFSARGRWSSIDFPKVIRRGSLCLRSVPGAILLFRSPASSWCFQKLFQPPLWNIHISKTFKTCMTICTTSISAKHSCLGRFAAYLGCCLFEHGAAKCSRNEVQKALVDLCHFSRSMGFWPQRHLAVRITSKWYLYIHTAFLCFSDTNI